MKMDSPARLSGPFAVLKRAADTTSAAILITLATISVAEAQRPILVAEQHNDNYAPRRGYEFVNGRTTWDPAQLSPDNSNQFRHRIFNFLAYDVPKNRGITFQLPRVGLQVRTYDHRSRSVGYFMWVELCNVGDVERFVNFKGVGSRVASGISPGFPPANQVYRRRHQILAPGNCQHFDAQGGLTSTDGSHARLIFDIHTTFDQAREGQRRQQAEAAAQQRAQAEAQAAADRQRAQEEQRRQQAAAQQRAAQERRAREAQERQREEEERLRQEEEARLLAEAERAQREEEDRLRREAADAERARLEELVRERREAVNRCNPGGIYRAQHYPRDGDFSNSESYVCMTRLDDVCRIQGCGPGGSRTVDVMIARGGSGTPEGGACYNTAQNHVASQMRFSPFPSRADVEEFGFSDPTTLAPIRWVRTQEYNARVHLMYREYRNLHTQRVTQVVQCLEAAGVNFNADSLDEYNMWGTSLSSIGAGEGARPGDPG